MVGSSINNKLAHPMWKRQNVFLPGLVSLESGCFAVLISTAFVKP
jgi:hypothetical protein